MLGIADYLMQCRTSVVVMKPCISAVGPDGVRVYPENIWNVYCVSNKQFGYEKQMPRGLHEILCLIPVNDLVDFERAVR